MKSEVRLKKDTEGGEENQYFFRNKVDNKRAVLLVLESLVRRSEKDMKV